MKAVFISYSQAHHTDIIAVMERLNIKGYSAWEVTTGRGTNGGDPHLGDHAWPTLSSSMLTMVKDDQVADFLQALKKIDDESPKMGLRAFTWKIEETI